MGQNGIREGIRDPHTVALPRLNAQPKQMNTVYRRKTKQPLYLVSCYLVSGIYVQLCVFLTAHICEPVCVCVRVYVQKLVFVFCTAGKQQLLHPLAQMQKCCKLIFVLSVLCRRGLLQFPASGSESAVARLQIEFQHRLQEIKQVLYLTEPPSELSNCQQKVCLTNNATPHGENVLSFKCVVAPRGRFIMFNSTKLEVLSNKKIQQ